MGRTGVVVGLLVAWLALVTPAPAAGQPPAEETAQGSMMFVLDASGSMTDRLPAGGTKMDAARTAMNTLIDGLPVNIHVGLEAYGTSTGNSPGEKAAGCQDVRVLAPVGRVDRDALRAQVAAIRPRGYTPIGRSLEQAAAALPGSGPRAIVLVSDGIDTCAPPAPCEVAKALDGAGVELAVHAIGFQVEPAAREQLECVAGETGGEYHDAPDAKALEELLPEIADRALRHYQVRGESVNGATSMAEAQYLVPGQYIDDVERKTPQYYQVHVPEGATGHVTVVHTVEQGPYRSDSGVDLRLLDGQEKVCAENRGFREFGYDGPETASVSWTAAENSRCDPAGPHYVEVTWDNLRDDALDEIELLFAVEAPVSGDAGSPAEEVVEFSAPATGQDVVWGGGSFNEAATLPGTGRYLDRIHYSEYSVYKVWLEWGQALSYQVTFADGAEVGRATAATELRGPTRAGMRERWWRSTDYTGRSVAIEPVATPEVSYANRDGKFEQAAHEGWYYVVVKLSPVWTEGEPVPEEQPAFELALTVSGSAAGGPSYEEVSVPSSAPPAVPSSSAAASASASSASSPFGFAAGESAFRWWVVAMVGGVVLFGVVVVVVLRRRSVPPGR
jgi:Ca-activated chloride channel homolog